MSTTKSKCATCGYAWETGRDGRHSCSTQLRKELDALRETGPVQKAFWEGFERAKASDSFNIRQHWEEYKTILKAKTQN